MATLSDYYTSQGKTLPSVGSRFNDPAFANAAKQAGVSSKGYTGSYEQNLAIGKYLNPTTTAKEPTKPVSSLSTTSAQKTYQGLVDQLDKIKASAATLQPTPTKTEPTAKVPTATFTNEAGQTAIYTQEQLNDPNIQQQIKSGGFVMSATEGPSLQAGEYSQAEQQVENLANQIATYNVENDPAFAAKATEIKNKYAKLRDEMKQVNYQRSQTFQTLGFRYGTTQYGGGMQMGIENSELDQANKRLADIDAQEQAEINATREAMRTGKYTEFYKTMDALEKTRQMKKEALESYSKTVGDYLAKTEEQKRLVQRDTVIAQMMSQGITDPIELLTTLNQSGMNITAKELGETMKNMTGTDNTEKLTGDTRNFYLLKNSNNLPESISKLPESQQLFSYIRMINDAERKQTTGETTKSNVITISEAKSTGLPLSVVGMDEPTVIASLSLPTAPKWWIDVAKSKGITETNAITSSWNDMRKSILSSKTSSNKGREL